MEKHQNKINWVTIVTGIATIISVVTFFAKGYGNMAVANNTLDGVVQWKQEHTIEHKDVSDDISTIKNDVKRIKDLLNKKL